MRVNMHEAKSQLSRLARRAWQGEEIVICRSGRPWLRLMPYEERLQRRQPGGLEGRIRIDSGGDAEDKQVNAVLDNFELFPGIE